MVIGGGMNMIRSGKRKEIYNKKYGGGQKKNSSKII